MSFFIHFSLLKYNDHLIFILHVFHLYFIHYYYHLSHAVIFPAKPSVFKCTNFCNFSLLMMTLVWVITSNELTNSICQTLG